MTASARTGLLAVGGLVVAGLVAELAGRRRLVRRRRRRDNPGRHRNPWITSRGHRVHIDDEGRVDAGGIPRQWHGAHIRDVSELGRRWREIRRLAWALLAVVAVAVWFWLCVYVLGASSN